MTTTLDKPHAGLTELVEHGTAMLDAVTHCKQVSDRLPHLNPTTVADFNPSTYGLSVIWAAETWTTDSGDRIDLDASTCYTLTDPRPTPTVYVMMDGPLSPPDAEAFTAAMQRMNAIVVEVQAAS